MYKFTLQTTLKLNQEALDFIAESTANLSIPAKQFFTHMLHYALKHSPDEPGYKELDIPYSWIHSNLRSCTKAHRQELVDNDLIYIKEFALYNQKKAKENQCYTYMMDLMFLYDLFEHIDYSKNIVSLTKSKAKPYRKRKLQECLRKEGRCIATLPDIYAKAFNNMHGQVNLKSFEEFEREAMKPENTNEKILRRSTRMARRKLIVQDFDATGKYDLDYLIVGTGRLFGGFQKVSRPVKAVLFEGYFNYDLKNSQPTILVQKIDQLKQIYKDELAAKGIDLSCPRLHRYVAQPAVRETIAGKIGIPLPIWKDLFFQMLFGGAVRKFKSSSKSSRRLVESDLYKTVIEIFREIHDSNDYSSSNDWDSDLRELWKGVSEMSTKIVKAYKEEVDEWSRFLAEIYIPKHMRYGVIQNEVGLQFRFKEERKLKSGEWSQKTLNQFSAHLIQGWECAVMFTIVAESKETASCIHWDHDGGVFDHELTAERRDQIMLTVADCFGLEMQLHKKPIFEH